MTETINDYLNYLSLFDGIYIILLIILSTFISEDLTCITSGLLASQGKISIEVAVFASTMGIFVGDLGLYGIGSFLFRTKFIILNKYIGNKIFNFRNRLVEIHLNKIKIQLTKKGGWYIFISRFIPGTRLPMYLLANQIYPGIFRFSGILLLGCLIWTPILVMGSYWLGIKIKEYLNSYYNFWFYTLTLILMVYFSFIAVRYFSSYKNRKMFLGNLKRLYHWEFWPTWMLYFPIVLYIIYLGIRHRSFTLFTISNPGIPFSGLMGESKSSILNSIQNKSFIADFFVIPSEKEGFDRFNFFEGKMKEKKFIFPIILKPDIGERGKGVNIVHDKKQIEEHLSKNQNKIICQEYIGGIEYGIQFVRFPNENKVKILSLCHKVYYAIYGNGKDNLETLILNDARAVCQANVHLKKFNEHLKRIPVKGEKIVLSSIGTHSRGSMFLDANAEITKVLQLSVQKVVLTIPDIYIGRFDVKAKSKRDFFINGEFKILELNGLTGEPAHIYDPKHNVFYAWKYLMNTWNLGFKIGLINKKSGWEANSIINLYHWVVHPHSNRDQTFYKNKIMEEKP